MEHEQRLLLAEKQIARQHATDFNALGRRIELGRNEHVLQRDMDFARLDRRFMNIKAELEQQHGAENMKLEKANKLHNLRLTMSKSGAKRAASRDMGAEASVVSITSTITVQPSLIADDAAADERVVTP